MKLRRFVASAIALSLIAMACQVDLPPTAPPTAGTKLLPPPTVTAEPVEESGHQASEIGHLLDGQEVFATAGCAACHGEEAQGTDFAPGLAGHSIAQVKRQVRAPIGTMTVFPPEKISNEDLQELAEYIGGLEGGHAHARAGMSGDDLLMHHWMALFALEAGDIHDGSHHLDHILDAAEGQHLRMMEQSKDLLSEGGVHEAEHIIEEMLAGLDEAEIDLPTMHMRLALSSLKADDLTNVVHQVEHFAEVTSEVNHESAQHLLMALTNGDLDNANETMVMLLGDDYMADDHGESGHDEAMEEPHEEDMHAHEVVDAHNEADEHAHEAEATPEGTVADIHEEDIHPHEMIDTHDETNGHLHEEANEEVVDQTVEEEHPDDGHSH